MRAHLPRPDEEVPGNHRQSREPAQTGGSGHQGLWLLCSGKPQVAFISTNFTKERWLVCVCVGVCYIGCVDCWQVG